MAMTLLEASKLNKGDVVRSAVIEMFAASSDILGVLPFMDIPGGSYHYNQEGSLPGVAFRGVNEAYAESVGIINPQVEVLRIGGGDLDVDKALLKMHGEGVRSTHEAMKIKAMALYWTKKFIKGDSVADPREFDGLQARCTGSQLIAAGATANGTPLSLTKLDELIDAVDNPTHLVMNKALVRRLSAAARTTAVGGDIEWVLNDFGKRVTVYNGLPILVADYDDLGARFMDFDEAATSGTSTASSIYAISVGEGMLTGIQNGTMDVKDLGEINDKPVYRTRVEWLNGFVALHGRCAARLWSISDAAVTA
jgi:hypothetical protein